MDPDAWSAIAAGAGSIASFLLGIVLWQRERRQKTEIALDTVTKTLAEQNGTTAKILTAIEAQNTSLQLMARDIAEVVAWTRNH